MSIYCYSPQTTGAGKAYVAMPPSAGQACRAARTVRRSGRRRPG
jgi:hypothetical protein